MAAPPKASSPFGNKRLAVSKSSSVVSGGRKTTGSGGGMKEEEEEEEGEAMGGVCEGRDAVNTGRGGGSGDSRGDGDVRM